MSKNLKGMGGIAGQMGGKLGALTSGFEGILGNAKLLANPYMAVGAAVAGATAAYVKYNAELERTKLLTEQFLGVTGNELSSVRANIQALSTTFNKDFKTVLASTETIMRQFGVSASQAVSVLQDGFVAGADDGGKLLDMIDRFGPALRDAGIGAEEMMALLGQTRSGLFNEKALDLIKEAGKNFRIMQAEGKRALSSIGVDYDKLASDLNSGSITMLDVIKSVSTEINKLPEGSTQAAQAMKALYSEKFIEGGEQLIRSFATLSTNLDEVKKQTGIVGQAQEDLINATTEWELALDSLFGSSQGGWSTFTTQLKTGVLVALTKCIDAVIELYNSSAPIRGVVHGIGALISNIARVLKQQFQVTMNFIKTAGKIVEAVLSGNFKNIDNLLAEYEKEHRRIMSEMTSGMGKDWTEMWDKTVNGKLERKTKIEDEETTTSKKVYNTQVEKTTSTKSSLNQLKADLQALEQARDAGDESAETLKKIADLKKKISQKEIELGIRTAGADKVKALTGSLQAYKDELAKVQKQRDAGQIDPQVAKTKIADLEKKIKDKEIELGITPTFNPESLSGLKEQLAEVNKQIEEGKYFELDPSIKVTEAELIKLKVDIENKIDAINIRVKFNQEKQKLDTKSQEILVTPVFTKPKSTFEQYVPQEQTSVVEQAEFKLSGIQEQMDLNDDLIEKIKTLMAEYEKLGATGTDAYNQLNDKLQEVNNQQIALGTEAIKTNQTIQDSKKSEKTFEALGSSVGSFGSALSSLGGAFEMPELNIAGVIAQGIASMVMGAGEAIAQAGALGPIGWIAFGAAIMAQLAAMIAQVHSLSSYASGGLIHSGSSVGDMNMVRVNGGEMVLNDT
jgi:hypothetical protein